MKTNYKNKTISRLAILLALIVLLDYVSRVLPFFKTPNGGTLSFVPTIFILVAIIANPLQGFIFGCIASIFTFFIGSQWFINFWQFLFDYPLAIGGAIAIGSTAWRLWSKWNLPYFVKVAMLSLKVTSIQFISYTIAFYFYISKAGIGLESLTGIELFLKIFKYNIVYMGPIIIGNTILATLVIPRIKNIIE